MKKIIRLTTALFLFALAFSTTSCNKDEDFKKEPIAVQLLTAKTWQIEEVVEITDGEPPHITYKRGIANNEDDFSRVRQTFKKESIQEQLLTAKTWQIEEVAEITDGEPPHITYKRGIANNEDDFSRVRQTFKKDGSIVFIDQEEESGSNGRYQLLENNMLRLSWGFITNIVERVAIRENSFSYRLVHEDGYTQFTFSPAP